jgi:hypothetical protein
MQLALLQGSRKRYASLWDRLLANSAVMPNGCRVWTGATTEGKGGGRRPKVTLRVGGKLVSWIAYRLAYRLSGRRLRRGLVIKHSCDNSLCIEPKHLSQGTYGSNNRETVKRKRHRRGQRVEQGVLSLD